MVKLCICNSLLTITVFCMVYLLYRFTSTFVWMSASSLLLLFLIGMVTGHIHSNNCLEKGLSGCFFVVVVAIYVCGVATILQNGHKCYFNECCDTNWITPNITGLSVELKRKLDSQHLAINSVVKHLRAHVEGQSRKATVLSIHGYHGTGKNFLSRMVAEHMFVKGMDSKYVHILSAAKDFPHENMLEKYKEELKLKIETARKECSRSLFIIDEMDQLSPGLIDTIRPFLDYYDQASGIDYRHLLFFFLSTTGGDAIAKYVETSYEQGGKRSDVNLKEMQEVVRLSSFTERNGLFHSSIVKDSLITAYIPFLPLERKHVEKCIMDALFEKEINWYQVDAETFRAIANEILDFPVDTRLFSTTECKRVLEKIDLIMQGEA